MSETIIHNLKTINNRIEVACERAGRNRAEVRLLLATKTVDSERIKFALNQGETLVGENKVQELQQKCEAIAVCNPEVHFIGHLQTNKIKDVITKNRKRKLLNIDKLSNNSIIEIDNISPLKLLELQTNLIQIANAEEILFVHKKGNRKSELQKLFEALEEASTRLLKYKEHFKIMRIWEKIS